MHIGKGVCRARTRCMIYSRSSKIRNFDNFMHVDPKVWNNVKIQSSNGPISGIRLLCSKSSASNNSDLSYTSSTCCNEIPH